MEFTFFSLKIGHAAVNTTRQPTCLPCLRIRETPIKTVLDYKFMSVQPAILAFLIKQILTLLHLYIPDVFAAFASTLYPSLKVIIF